MGARINDYRELLAWQQAIELALKCEVVCGQLPRSAFDLACQLKRAAQSVYSNIAEGNGRPSIADYLRLLGYAKGSLNEVGSNLAFIVKRYGRTTAVREAEALVRITDKLLNALIRSLRDRRDRE